MTGFSRAAVSHGNDQGARHAPRCGSAARWSLRQELVLRTCLLGTDDHKILRYKSSMDTTPRTGSGLRDTAAGHKVIAWSKRTRRRRSRISMQQCFKTLTSHHDSAWNWSCSAAATPKVNNSTEQSARMLVGMLCQVQGND